jgi:rod shape-determining protein MreD
VRFVKVVLALAAALVLQTTIAGLAIRATAALDLVLIVVVYVALTSGPTIGLLAGSLGGLAQDALSSGILGISGLAKTIVGFAAGVLATQFIVTTAFPRLVVVVLATVLHALVFMGLSVLLDLRQFPSPYRTVAGQAIANALVAVVAFHVVELLPGAFQRRRAARLMKR